MDEIASQIADILARGAISIADARRACERARRLAGEARKLRERRQARMTDLLSAWKFRGPQTALTRRRLKAITRAVQRGCVATLAGRGPLIASRTLVAYPEAQRTPKAGDLPKVATEFDGFTRA